jgi:hypothetical protein
MSIYEDLVGKSAEIAAKTFLERDGYKVLPYGVEYALRTGICVTTKQYWTLGLSEQIRRTPDFLVISPKCEYWRLLEVKYRSHWDETTRNQLKQSLADQASNWENVHVLIVLREPVGDGREPDNQIRIARTLMVDNQLCVLGSNNTVSKNWDEVGWEDFNLLKESFPECCGDKFGISRFRELADFFQNLPKRFDDEILTRQVVAEARKGIMSE